MYLDPQTTPKQGNSPTIILGCNTQCLSWTFESRVQVQVLESYVFTCPFGINVIAPVLCSQLPIHTSLFLGGLSIKVDQKAGTRHSFCPSGIHMMPVQSEWCFGSLRESVPVKQLSAEQHTKLWPIFIWVLLTCLRGDSISYEILELRLGTTNSQG